MPAPDYAVEIAALEAAVAAGELTVESDGDRVTYRSMADLLAALGYFRQRAAVLSGSGAKTTTTLAAYAGG